MNYQVRILLTKLLGKRGSAVLTPLFFILLPAGIALGNQIVGNVGTNFAISPNGQSNYAVPIDLPPGINNLAPRLAFQYGSTKGNGLLGRGWGISGIGEITRCAQTIAQDGKVRAIQFDDEDQYCLNGSRLILTAGTHAAAGAEYRQEIDQRIKVAAIGSANGAPVSFKAYSADGRVYEYGATEDSRVEVQTSDDVRSWSLNQVTDPSGNFFTVKYHEDTEYGEFYPEEIEFTGNSNVNQDPDNKVIFKYDSRPDPVYSCLKGNLVQSSKRLAHVEVYAGEKQTRTYQLGYDKSSGGPKRISAGACEADELMGAGEQGDSDYQQLLDKKFEEEHEAWQLRAKLDQEAQNYLDQISGLDAEYRRELLSRLASLNSDKARLAELYLQSQTDLENSTDEELDLRRAELETALAAQVEIQAVESARINGEYDVKLEEEQQKQSTLTTESEEDLLARSIWLNKRLTKFRNKTTEFQSYKTHQSYTEVDLRRKYTDKNKKSLHTFVQADLVNRAEALEWLADHYIAKWDYYEAVAVADEQGDSPSMPTIDPPDFEDCGLGLLEPEDCISIRHEKLEALTSDPRTLADGYRDLAIDIELGELAFLEFHHVLNKESEQGNSYIDLSVNAQNTYKDYLAYAGHINLEYEKQVKKIFSQAVNMWAIKHMILDGVIDEMELRRRAELEEEFQKVAGYQEQLASLGLEGLQQVYQNKLAQLDAQELELQALLENAISNSNSQGDFTQQSEHIDIRARILGFRHGIRSEQFESQLDELLNSSGSILAEEGVPEGGSLIEESRLLSIKVCAGDGSCMPPLQFGWLTDSTGWETEVSQFPFGPAPRLDGSNENEGGSGNGSDGQEGTDNTDESGSENVDTEQVDDKFKQLARYISDAGVLVDINADGLPDWVLAVEDENNIEYRATWLNTEGGWEYSLEYTMPTSIGNLQGLPYGEFLDINNDGYLDWVGGAVKSDGQVLSKAYINTQFGWEENQALAFPSALYVGTQIAQSAEFSLDHVSKQGEFVRLPAGNTIAWLGARAKNDSTIERESYIWKDAAWQQVSIDFPGVVTSVDEEGVSRPNGVFVDLDQDGFVDWISAPVNGVENSSGVWLNKVSGWQGPDVFPEYSDFELEPNQPFAMFDINDDGYLDIVSSMETESGLKSIIYQNTGAGWLRADELGLPAALYDINHSTIGDIIDVDGNGLPDMLLANLDRSAHEYRATYINGSLEWSQNYAKRFPRIVRQQEVPAGDDLVESEAWRLLGEFADLNGDSDTDWLNKGDVWSAETDGMAVVLDDSEWNFNATYRLPSMNKRWLSALAKEAVLHEAVEGDSQVTKNLLDSVSGNPLGLTEAIDEVTVTDPDETEGATDPAIQGSNGQFIDLNNDGRLDWVVALRRNSAEDLKYVWEQSDSGWQLSDSFVPPTYLSDAINKGYRFLVDINSDGKPDWVESYFDESDTPHQSVWLNDGSQWVLDETISLPTPLTKLSNGRLVSLAILADVNGDRLLDVVPANNFSELCTSDSCAAAQTVWLGNAENGGGAIDWQSSAYSSLPTGFSASGEGLNSRSGVFIDVNGDALPDWLSTNNGVDATWINAGGEWVDTPMYKLPTAMMSPEGNILGKFVDINRDGLRDWIVAYRKQDGHEIRSSWLNTGTGWRRDDNYILPGALTQVGEGTLGHLIDVNADGWVDFAQHFIDDFGHRSKSVWLNTGLGWAKSNLIALPTLMAELELSGKVNQKAVLVDINSDYRSDVLRFNPSSTLSAPEFEAMEALGGVNARVDKFTKGAFQTQVTYSRGYQPDVVERDSSNTYPFLDLSGTATVASEYQLIINGETVSDKSYRYGGKVFDQRGRGDLGYRWTTEEDKISELSNYVEYRQDFPYTGMILESKAILSGDLTLTSAENKTFVDQAPIGTRFHAPKVQNRVIKNFDIGGQLVSTVTNAVTKYDAFAYPEVTTTTKTEAGGATFISQATTIYEHDTEQWLLGRIKSTSLTKTSPYDVAGKQQTRSTAFTYDPQGRVKTSLAAGVQISTDYDDRGNKTRITKSAEGWAPLVETIEFDKNGQFPILNTSVTGETTAYIYSPVDGNVIEYTSPEGKTTKFRYDGWGRKKKQITDTTTSTWLYKFCPSGSSTSGCPANARYLSLMAEIREGEDAIDTNESPEIIYFDTLGREVRRAIADSQGKIVYTDTNYDIHGRVISRSSPYFKGDANPPSAKFEYDILGRKVFQSRFGGGATTWVYDGLKTIETNPKRQVTTTRFNLEGMPVSVEDALGGLTRYEYDAFSQIAKTTDAQQNVMTVEHDERGNKRFVNDPDKGRIEFAYHPYGWPTKQINPDGTSIEYSYDDFGRKETRTELEGTTTWTYASNSSDPNRLKTITGYDGFKHVFTYDDEGRLESETQRLPNGDAYKKELTYWGDSHSIRSMRYPNGVSIRQKYNDFGYFTEVSKGGADTYKKYENKFEQAKGKYEEAKGKWEDGDEYDTGIDAAEAQKLSAIADANAANVPARKWNDKVNEYVRHINGKTKQIDELSKKIQSLLTYTDEDGVEHKAKVSAVPEYVEYVKKYIECKDRVIEEHKDNKGAPVSAECGGYLKLARKSVFRAIDRYKEEALELIQRRENIQKSLSAAVRQAKSAAAKVSGHMARATTAAEEEYRLSELKYDLYVEGNELVKDGDALKDEADRLYSIYESHVGQVYWQRGEMTATNQQINATYGNGLITNYIFNADGGMEQATTKNSEDEVLIDWRYKYDQIGNVISRRDDFSGSKESFYYDSLNRLVRSDFQTSIGISVLQNVEYDLIGNIVYKTGVGNYTYGSSKPHVVTSIDDEELVYDTVGNLKTGKGIGLTYTSFGKPTRIEKTESSDEYAEFIYGPRRSAYYEKNVSEEGTTESWKLFGGEYSIRKNGETNTVTVNVSNGQSVIASIVLDEGESGADTSHRTFLKSAIAKVAALEADSDGKVALSSGLLNGLLDAAIATKASKDQGATPTDTQIGHAKKYIEDLEPNDAGLLEIKLDIPRFLAARVLYRASLKGEFEAGATATITATVPIALFPNIKGKLVETDVVVPQLIADYLADPTSIDLSLYFPDGVSQRISYMHHDQLGSVIATSNQLGEITSRPHYDAWGQPIGGLTVVDGQFSFTGHQFISGVDLVHMNGRIYDPVIGRFLSADLFVPEIYNPQSLNRYAYVYNNPLKYVDPNGYTPSTYQLALNEHAYLALASIALGQNLDKNDFYELRHLQLTNPEAAKAKLREMGIQQEAWSEGVESLVDAAWQNKEILKAIRKARRRARAVFVVRVVVNIVIGPEADAIFYAIGEAAITYAATGDVDAALRSFASAYVTQAIPKQLGTLGLDSALGDMIVKGIARGASNAILGGEFEDGFVAGFVAAGLQHAAVSLEFDLHNEYLDATLWGALAGGINAELSGRKFKDGAEAGAIDGLFHVYGVKNFPNTHDPRIVGSGAADFAKVGRALTLAIDGDLEEAFLTLFGYAVDVGRNQTNPPLLPPDPSTSDLYEGGVTVVVVDENGQPVLDENGEPVTMVVDKAAMDNAETGCATSYSPLRVQGLNLPQAQSSTLGYCDVDPVTGHPRVHGVVLDENNQPIAYEFKDEDGGLTLKVRIDGKEYTIPAEHRGAFKGILAGLKDGTIDNAQALALAVIVYGPIGITNGLSPGIPFQELYGASEEVISGLISGELSLSDFPGLVKNGVEEFSADALEKLTGDEREYYIGYIAGYIIPELLVDFATRGGAGLKLSERILQGTKIFVTQLKATRRVNKFNADLVTSGKASLTPGFEGKDLNRLFAKERYGDENFFDKDEIWSGPFPDNANVTAVVATSNLEFVRVSKTLESGKLGGSFLVPASEIAGMGRDQIQKHLALDFTPAWIQDVRVPPSVTLYAGNIGQQLKHAIPNDNPGGIQYMINPINDDFGKVDFGLPRTL